MPNNFQTQVSEVELNVFDIITVPEVVVSNVSIVEGEPVTLSWPSSDDAVWYSILLQNDLGETTEYYNGTSSSVDVSDLEPGLNRLRVRTGSADGKMSDYSASVFVTVEADSEPADSPFFGIIFTVGLIALFGWILTSRAQRD